MKMFDGGREGGRKSGRDGIEGARTREKERERRCDATQARMEETERRVKREKRRRGGGSREGGKREAGRRKRKARRILTGDLASPRDLSPHL